MSEIDEAEKTREQGIEFGELTDRIFSHEYPATSDDFIDEYGDYEVEFPGGAQTLQNLFEPLQGETFDSSDDARQAILNMVDERAIGRKGYSDRNSPVIGEETEWTPESL